jgi:hypothetical protein
MALADTGNEYDSVISSVFVAARLIFAISKPLATPWATSFYNKSGSDDFGANGFEIANISLAATKTLDITESYSLPVSAKAIWNPATEGAYFVFGINF